MLTDEAAAGAAVTAVVSAAAGGVHFAVVTMLAVAVNLTEVTEAALAATGICASRTAGRLAVTEAIAHEVPPLPLAQPLLNFGFSLDGCDVSVTDTLAAEPFLVETCTTYPAVCPRWTLACERCTLTHSSVAEVVLGLGLGLGLPAT
ncbi:MAG: hypothetical protein JO132_04275 [Streptosporangiaceae bacterium]|nr:hypothetical protein [Streptosporangiaceae bacterium]